MVPAAVLDALRRAARDAARDAYCPYSRHAVGAAVLGADDSILTGCNVENASYGLTLCAERVALAKAAAAKAFPVAAVVVYAVGERLFPPCGACRQTLHELGPEALVHAFCDGPASLTAPLASLLPHPFDAGPLGPVPAAPAR